MLLQMTLFHSDVIIIMLCSDVEFGTSEYLSLSVI